MTRQVATEKLREIPLFAGLSDDALTQIAETVSEIEYPAGAVLAVADDPGAGMFVIEDGWVVVEARHRTIELGPGEFFGSSRCSCRSRSALRVCVPRRLCGVWPSAGSSSSSS